MNPNFSRPRFTACSEISNRVMRMVNADTGRPFSYVLFIPERQGSLLTDNLQDVVSEIIGGFGVDDTYRTLNQQDELDAEKALQYRIEAMRACVDVHLAEVSHGVAHTVDHAMTSEEIVLTTVCPTEARESDLKSRGYWNQKPWTAPIRLPLVGWKSPDETYWPEIPDHHGDLIYIIDVSTDESFMAGITELGLMDFRTNLPD